MNRSVLALLLILSGLSVACQEEGIRYGAQQTDRILSLIGTKKIAVVANQASLVEGTHLVDTLLSAGLGREQLVRVFAPEHGFRGDASAGNSVKDGIDPETGIPVVSLYGNRRKPTPENMEDVELVLFDLQDVGVRFYTYISTLHYVMEACAENGVPLLVLDRPNPNDGFVDGPVLQPAFRSFVGMHPIPVVYGLTIGELARMINGEGWLAGGIACDLRVIECRNYSHGMPWPMRLGPSPNLSNVHAIHLYPSTCFFEGTVVSEGRGTPYPFEIYGHPEFEGTFTFTPVSIPGKAENPKFPGRLCHGYDLREFVPVDGWNRIHLQWLLGAYGEFPEKDSFFTSYFDTLAGTSRLREEIEGGWSEERIRASWEEDLEAYRSIRRRYLIYP